MSKNSKTRLKTLIAEYNSDGTHIIKLHTEINDLKKKRVEMLKNINRLKAQVKRDDALKKGWNCSECTFENNAGVLCAVCNSERPEDNHVEQDGFKESEIKYTITQQSPEYGIVYSCTTMAAFIATMLFIQVAIPEEQLGQIFQKFSKEEKDKKLKKHTALDTALDDIHGAKILSRDTISIPGMPIEGPAMILDAGNKQSIIDFFHEQIQECITTCDKVCFVACGGSTSFGGCVEKNGEYCFLETHRQDDVSDGSYFYSGNDKKVLDRFLSYTIVDELAPFQVLIFTP